MSMLAVQNQKYSDGRIIALCVGLSAIIFAMDLLIPLGVAAGVPYIIVVLISLRSPRRKLPVYMAVLGSLLTVAGFGFSPFGGELWKVMVNRAIALFAIWATAILAVQRAEFQREGAKAQSELKKLEGLLPICSACKKIRDNDGSWSQIESYIRRHSEAEFSHGICPECTRRLYPDIDL